MGGVSEIKQLHNRYERLKARFAHRDMRMGQVTAIREGRMADVAPGIFPSGGPFQEPIIANMIDVAARDCSEMLAPLPSFNCALPTMTSEASRNRATLKTRVASGYVSHSNLAIQMYSAADWYVTYGFVCGRIEIDHDQKMPMLRMLNPVGCYPETDRLGRVTSLFQRAVLPRDELAAKYPEFAGRLLKDDGWGLSRDVEVIFHHDADADTAYVMDAEGGVLLTRVPNRIGKCMVAMAARPGTSLPRGQFDDVMWVQLAKSRMALLALQAAHETVNAPLVVPNDVPDLPLGPGAMIRTQNPQGVRRAGIDLPQAAFAEQAQLDRELMQGARFPSIRNGIAPGSGTVTGKGNDSLMGGYDTSIRTHQAMFARLLTEMLMLAFEVDETLWPNVPKVLRASENGTPIEVKYVPHAAIRGDYTIDCTYGLMAGLDPNRWLVFGLQALGAKMFSRDFLRREMPVELNVEDEARKIDIEDLEEAAKQALMAYAQSIPALASAGQDPSGPLSALATVIEGRRKGKPLADLVVGAFAPKPKPAPPEGAPAPDGGDTGGNGDMPPPGLEPSGLMQGVPPGQAGMAPGGMPSVETLMAGLNAKGQPALSAGIRRRTAIA